MAITPIRRSRLDGSEPKGLNILLTDRLVLERCVRGPTTPPRVVRRCRIVLLLGQGLSGRAVARLLRVSRHTVDLWRSRYLSEGYGVLTHDRTGRGRKGRKPDRER